MGRALNLSHLTDADIQELIAVEWPSIHGIHRYAATVISPIGVVLNAICLSVWAKKKMRRRSGIYLSALAISCIVFSATRLLKAVSIDGLQHSEILGITGVCQTVLTLMFVALHMSPLLVLAFTVERYISICRPFHRKKYCTNRVAVIVVTCLTIYSICMNGVVAYRWHVHKSMCGRRDNSFSPAFVYTSEAISFSFCPFMTVVLDVLVIREMHRLGKMAPEVLRAHVKDSPVTMVTLIIISTYFTITIVPGSICFYLEPSYLKPSHLFPTSMVLLKKNPVWRRYVFKMIICRICYTFFSQCHYTYNFFIYWGTSASFRYHCKKNLLTFFCMGAAARKFMNTFSTLFISISANNLTSSSNAINTLLADQSLAEIQEELSINETFDFEPKNINFEKEQVMQDSRSASFASFLDATSPLTIAEIEELKAGKSETKL